MPRGTHKNHRRGENHYRWNAGKMVASTGYVKLRLGKDHPLSDGNGYAYEHLVVWVEAGNVLPRPNEIIHHRNEDKTDNRIENLELLTREDHAMVHHDCLPNVTVRFIREEYAAGRMDMPTLASRFGVPFQRVSKLIRGETRLSAGGPISKNNRGKHRAGRILDGRTWDEYPEGTRG